MASNPSSKLVAFIHDGFEDVFKAHCLLSLGEMDVLHLLWTCKDVYKHWRSFIRYYARNSFGRCCNACEDEIPMPGGPRRVRPLVWVYCLTPVEIPGHRRDYNSLSSVDSDDSDDELWCPPVEPFLTQCLWFHDWECIMYSSRDFVTLDDKPNGGPGVWTIRCDSWQCTECDVCSDLSTTDCIQIYPLPKIKEKKH